MSRFSLLNLLSLVAVSLAAPAQQQSTLFDAAVPSIPRLGFGTWQLDPSNASEAVSVALETGYRHIDAAAIYGNEKEVGKGIKQGLHKTGLKREDIWVTSKLWNTRHSPSEVADALDQTLDDLGLEYLDLYLMHWPVANHGGQNTIDFLDTWDAMSNLVTLGVVRHIGVSNFSPDQLHELLSQSRSRVVPYAHQMELHPHLPQTEFLSWHETKGIHVTAYSPLANSNPIYSSGKSVAPLLEDKLVKKIAHKRDCTTAQVALAWGMHRGTSVIPKSAHTERIVENYNAAKCHLKKKDIAELDSLPIKRFNNPSKGWGVELYKGLQDASSSRYQLLSASLDKSRAALATLWSSIWQYVGADDDL